jgi:hypothetical protein
MGDALVSVFEQNHGMLGLASGRLVVFSSLGVSTDRRIGYYVNALGCWLLLGKYLAPIEGWHCALSLGGPL